MRMYIESGRLYLEANDQTFFHTIEEWSQFFKKCNWFDFHFWKVYLMWDICVPGVEAECILLGLGIRFRMNFDWEGTEFGDRLEEFRRSRDPNPCDEDELS